MSPRPGRAAAGLLLAVAAGLYSVTAWQVGPGFYDGFAPPADTYRWVRPPDGITGNGETPLPGSAALLVSSDRTRVAAGAAATGDKPPQAQLAIPAGSFNAPSAAMVEVDLTPSAAPGRPDNAVIVGNLYCVTATASLARDAELQLSLRYSDQLPSPNAIFRYDDQTRSWSELTALHDGRAAVVTAPIGSLGCYAPALVASATRTATARKAPAGNRYLPYIAAGAALLVLLAGLPLYLRLRRERRLRQRT